MLAVLVWWIVFQKDWQKQPLNLVYKDRCFIGIEPCASYYSANTNIAFQHNIVNQHIYPLFIVLPLPLACDSVNSSHSLFL